MKKAFELLTIPVLLFPAFLLIYFIIFSSTGVTWQWAISTIITLILFPTASLFWLKFEKELTDVDLDIKKERIVSFGLLVLLYGSSFINSYILSAPKLIQALNLTLFILIAFLFAITWVWKISGHMVAISFMAVIIYLLQGNSALLFIPLAVFIGWQRYSLKHHTIGQLLAGTILGVLITFSIFKIYGL